MNASNINTAPHRLRGWWSSPPRSGMQRLLAPWEYRHLRFWATVRAGAGIVLIALGIITVSFGGSNWTTYGWTIALEAAAAAQFSWAYWELTIARSTSPRT
jgi:hypothetical protein